MIYIGPASFLKGTIDLPGSKSYSIRAFLIAACGGTSLIKNPSDCDDARVAMNVANFLGTHFIESRNTIWKSASVSNAVPFKMIKVKESGTVLRFLLPLLALKRQPIIITGEGTLKGRPNHFLLETLRQRGVHIKGKGAKESIPIYLQGGQFKAGRITIDGSLSSQFISALLIACPQLEDNTHLTLKGEKIVSSDYITMTLQVLKKAGVVVYQKTAREFFIKGRQKFNGFKNFNVPSDYGLAAFLLAGAALIKSEVTLKGHLKDDLVQADGAILSFLKTMGVRFIKTSRLIKIKGPFQLRGGTFSLKDCPDLVPIMTILALFAKGKTRLIDIEHARVKESDRITDLRGELLKVGAHISETSNSLVITPQAQYKGSCLLDPHHDHRLAMAFAILGLKIGVYVKDIQCTAKSYPKFMKDLKSLIC